MNKVREIPGFFSCLIIVSLPLLINCAQVNRESLFAGDFGNVDLSPPKLIAPVSDYKTKNMSVTFSWSAVQGSYSYQLEVAYDNSFSQMINGSPFQVKDESYKIDFSEDYTIYWRVRSNINPPGTYSSIHRLHLLKDSLKVYCASTEAQCTNTDRVGNRSFPYREIGSILNEAKALGLKVEIAPRGNNTAYIEYIDLVEGVSIYGGFDAETWTRNPADKSTIIENNTDQVISAQYFSGTEKTYIDNLTIQSTGTANTIQLVDVNNQLWFQNSVLVGPDGTHTNTVSALRSSPVFYNNRILLGSSSSSSHGVRFTDSSEPYLINNIIIGSNSGPSSYAIRHSSFNSAHVLTLYGNTIFSGEGGTNSFGVVGQYSSRVALINNIIFAFLSANSACVEMPGVNVARNNNLFNCTNKISIGTSDYTEICSDGKLGTTPGCSSGTGGATITGNMSIANTGNQLFSDVNAPQTGGWQLKSASANICNVLFGGLDLSTTLETLGISSTDFAGTTRTSNTTGLPCTLTAPANTTGAGWSIGAYERDN